MSKKLMSIAVNRSTKELIGYWIPKKGYPIIVTAYAVDDLEKKFKKKIEIREREDHYAKNHHKAIEYLAGQDKREIDLMIESTKGIIKNDKVK